MEEIKMSLDIDIYNWQNLPTDDVLQYMGLDEVPCWIDDGISILVIRHNSDILCAKTDGGEPEDQTFNRDLYWIPIIIKNAYDAGLEDSK